MGQDHRGALGFVLGVVSSYATEFVKLKLPVGALADLGTDYVTTTLLLEHDQGVQGELWVFPFLVSEKPDVERLVVGLPSNLDEFHQKLRNAGAIDANVTLGKLVVEGNRKAPIRILGMRAVIESATGPLTDGTLLVPGPQGAGVSMQVGFDLDDQLAPAVEVNAEEANVYDDDYFTTVPAFSKSTVELKNDEQQVFQILARTFTQHIRWRIELQLLVDGRTEKVIADLHGRPIETTALIFQGDSPTAPIESEYSQVYDMFASGDGRFIRTK